MLGVGYDERLEGSHAHALTLRMIFSVAPLPSLTLLIDYIFKHEIVRFRREKIVPSKQLNDRRNTSSRVTQIELLCSVLKRLSLNSLMRQNQYAHSNLGFFV